MSTPQPSHLTPSRRSVLATTVWSVPAITVATAAPAFAASEDNPRLSLNAPFPTLYSQSGIAGLRATVLSSTGRPLPGMTLTATLPTASNITFADSTRSVVFGPTDSTGSASLPAMVSPVLADNSADPGVTLAIDLNTTASQTKPPTLTRTLIQRGRNVLATVNTTQAHRIATYGVNVVGPYYAQSRPSIGSGDGLYRLGPAGAVMNTSTQVASFTYGAVADPVVVNGSTLVTYISRYAVGTLSHNAYGTPTNVGSTSVSASDWGVTARGPGLFSVRANLWVHDPSLPAGGQMLTSSFNGVVSRRTLTGRRTVTWSKTTAGAHLWRDGVVTDLPHVPDRAVPVGEDVFLLADRNALLRGTSQLDYPGITGAYAAVVGSDTNVASVWFGAQGKQLLWRPDGTVQEWSSPTPPASLASTAVVPLGYGYYRRGKLHYFEGREVFWGTANPVVTETGVSLFGSN